MPSTREAASLRGLPQGMRVQVAGAVICRQRPGTAKGFLFLSLEKETGIANVIDLGAPKLADVAMARPSTG
ncbi:hypothetical protein [Verrucomicrobium sp. 3C]|uniref:hypothetical protein n=1 Tax=Verrucomicrobium sp. 3C TaxID=1134055 RepID=UPI0003A06D5E|nr:hypothetical protein [Verrucomicrobium sp. 3C]